MAVKRKPVTLSIDSTLYQKYQKFCDKNGFVISKRFEIFAEKEMEAGWPDIEQIVAKKVKAALAGKTRLFILLLFILLFAPHGAEAGTQIKTVSYMLDQYLDVDTTQTDFASANDWNTRTINVYFPENSVKVRDAWVEFHATSTITSATAMKNISMKFNDVERSVIAKSPINKYLTGTTEEFNFWAFADVTPAFATVTNPFSANLTVNVTGPTTNQQSASLHITYEYDDTSVNQVNTVAFPLPTAYGLVAINTNTSFPYNVTIPELDTILNAWAEIHGMEIAAANGLDAKLKAAVGSDQLSYNYFMEAGSRASYDAVFLFNLNSSAFKANESFVRIEVTGVPVLTLGGQIYVTYNFSNNSVPYRAKTVSYFMGQDNRRASTADKIFRQNITISEPNATVTNLWARVNAGWTSATAGNIKIGGHVGATPVWRGTYTLDIDTENMNENHIYHPFNLSTLSNLMVNNTNVTVNATYSGTTSDTAGAELFMTYIHNFNSSAVSGQKTVKYFGTQTNTEVKTLAQDANKTQVQTFVPERGARRTSAYLYAIFMSNATANYAILTNISDGATKSYNGSVTKSNTAIRNTASLLSGDIDSNNNKVVNTTPYNWTLWFAQQAPAGSGAAFSARFVTTYEFLADNIAPSWSNITKNETPVQQNYWVNFTANWTDNGPLDFVVFSLNQTGTFVNSTLQAVKIDSLPISLSNLSLITAANNVNVSWQFHVNDSVGNSNVTTLQSFVVGGGGDSTAPTWDTQAQSAGTVSQFGTVNLSANVADETGLSVAFLSTNESGVWKNWTDGSRYGSPLNLSGQNGHASFIWSNYSLEGGANIGWRIYVNDTSANFAQTDLLSFTLLKTASISINPSVVELGRLQPGSYNSTNMTLGYNPLPFVINNTGNFAVNITIGAGNIFQTVTNPSIYFQFKSALNETGSVRDAVRELIDSFLNIPATASAVMVANMTNFTDDNDEIRVHVNITVPQGEPPANQTSVVTFTAAAAY